MADASLAGKVLVSIVSALVRTSPVAWHLEYEVRNPEQTPIWLVVKESLVLRRDGQRIELSYARGKMQPGAQPFGYFDPEVVQVPPGGSVRRSVEIDWPVRLSDLWNAEREVALPPGEYEVSVRIGYGTTPKPPPPGLGESVEAPVLRWQKEAVSQPTRLKLPGYKATPE